MRRPRPSYGVMALGLGVALTGGLVTLVPWYQAARWQASPEAARAVRNAAAPTPIWLPPSAVAASGAATSPSVAATAVTSSRGDPASASASEPEAATPIATASEATAPPSGPSDLEMTSAAFTFEDPPQPGARARLTVSVRNPTDQPSGPISLTVPLQWLAGYRLSDFDPPLVDGSQSATDLRLTFAGPHPGSDIAVSVDVAAVDEVIDSPTLTVVDAEGRTAGSAHPPTLAPPALPGPIYSIDIPRLRLHSGVLPVDWEPPLFVVGQVRTSAYVTEGNSVLVGHLRGATGYNVFDHLAELAPGDEVVAYSRGQTYPFVVTDKEVLPEDDTSLAQTTATPRLTLMTCAGDWNPLTRDYSDRLWVIAQPASAVPHFAALR